MQAEQSQNTMIPLHTSMDYPELKLIEKGSTKEEHTFKSFEQKWFSANTSNNTKLGKYSDAGGEEDVYIEHDSLVKLKCKQGRNECIEYYGVLALFMKFYKKWYVAEESKLKWVKVQRAKKTCILTCMVSTPENADQEVKPEIGRR
eukprot:13902288-Ditylum_brightwellii.AAC.1